MFSFLCPSRGRRVPVRVGLLRVDITSVKFESARTLGIGIPMPLNSKFSD